MRLTILRTGSSCADATAWRPVARRAAAVLCFVLAWVFGVPAFAQSDDDFMAAREAFRTGNRSKLDQLAPRLSSHVLSPYVTYWRVRQRLEEIQPTDVRDTIAHLADGPLSDRLRNDWLKVLGRRGDWASFQTDQVGIRSEDIDVTCYALQRRMAAGDGDAAEQVRVLWLRGRPLPDPCNAVFESALRTGALTQDDVWMRMRRALQHGQVTLAKRLSRYVPEREAPDPKALDQVAANPRAYLARPGAAPKDRGDRTVLIFAMTRLARTAPQEAATQWRSLAHSFTPEETEYVWGQLAYWGTMQHDPEALAWFGRAGKLTDNELEWRARAALRAGRWNELLAAVNAMSEGGRSQSEWRYWKARALKANGNTPGANAILAPLSAENDFYGLLAAEELGETLGPPAVSHRPSESEIKAIEASPSIRRSLALYRLGLRFEATREWTWAIGAFDDRQLIAAAELARRNELWDRAINTAERTRTLHDFGLRYLAPYREQFRAYAAEHGLDEAWVFGLVRQESRFVADARSSAGASGLMQLMPATAKWVAGKLGMKQYQQSLVTDLDINISLGTYYLRHVMDTLDNQPVLASAGYNAGPGRARAWRADEAMEAAIYAETIPFNETRDYVKKVMANATFYARVFGQRLTSLKERIGVIPPKSSASDGR
jgi:soluble lytic murein transglycosylase